MAAIAEEEKRLRIIELMTYKPSYFPTLNVTPEFLTDELKKSVTDSAWGTSSSPRFVNPDEIEDFNGQLNPKIKLPLKTVIEMDNIRTRTLLTKQYRLSNHNEKTSLKIKPEGQKMNEDYVNDITDDSKNALYENEETKIINKYMSHIGNILKKTKK